MTLDLTPKPAEENPVRDLLFDASPVTQRLLKPAKFLPNDQLDVSVSEDLKDFIVAAWATNPRDEGKRNPASHNASRGWLANVTEKKELGYGRWRLAATDFNACVIRSKWSHALKDGRVHFTDKAKIVFDYLISRMTAQDASARMKAEFKIEGKLPELPFRYSDHKSLPLGNYQTVAAVSSIGMEGSALFMEQGTGKTPVAVRRLMHEAQNFVTRRMMNIIVCPRAVRTNWKNELSRFATVPGRVVVLRGSAMDRVKQLIDVVEPDGVSKWITVICSYETLQRSWDALQHFQFDLAIADESHMFKSISTKRFQYMKMLRDNSRQRMILTGTPMGNHVTDYFAQLEFLGEGFSGFTSFKKFKEFYSKFAHKGDRVEVVGMDMERLPLLQERLTRLAFIITKAEALPELPEKQYDVHEVQMLPKQREVYESLRHDLEVEVAKDWDESENLKLTAENVLTKMLRLSQVTSGYVVTDEQTDDEGNVTAESKTVHLPTNPKIEALLEILKEKDLTQKTIVWTNWVPCIKQIGEALDRLGIKHVTYYGATDEKTRDAYVKQFNEDPETKVFVGNPKAGGTGLNLPGYVPDLDGSEFDHGCNADHTIFFSCNWSMFERAQAEDRNHGKNRCRVPGRITDLVCPGTIDEEIRVRVLKKLEAAIQVNDVRDIMKRVLSTPLEKDD